MKRLAALIAAFLLAAAPVAAAGPDSVHDFTVTAIEGHEISLADYRGQAVLLVNTASLCGFTYQYDGLQAVWERYRDKGLLVLAVPSDDFNQELASDQEVKDFCEANFGLDFPMTKKARVKGPGAHPIYRWTAERLGDGAVPRWNFHKILFDRQGQPVAGFSSSVEPQSRQMIEAIEALIAQAPADS